MSKPNSLEEHNLPFLPLPDDAARIRKREESVELLSRMILNS